MLEPILHDLELQLTDCAQDRLALEAVAVEEHLHDAFLGELVEALLELLALERLGEDDAHEALRRERGMPSNCTVASSLSVSPMRSVGIPQADDIAGERSSMRVRSCASTAATC